MDRPSLVRVVVAFVLGVALALGGALLVVHLRDRSIVATQTLPNVEEAASTPPATANTPPANPDETAQQPSQEPAAPTSVPEKPRPEPRHAVPVKTAKRTQSVAKTQLPPVRVVQNTPQPAPVTNSAPTYPAVTQRDVGQADPQALPQSGADVAQENLPTAAPPQADVPAQPNVVQLAEGTPLSIRLGETLSTQHNYTGDTFRGTLDAPIIRNGFVIADKGSKVLGRIVSAQEPGRTKGVGGLTLALTEINTTDGQRINVQTNSVEKRGPTSTGTDTAKIAGGAALGAIIGALGGGGKGAAIGAGAGGAAGTGVVLATRGKPAVIPSESRLTFQLASPVTITEKLNR